MQIYIIEDEKASFSIRRYVRELKANFPGTPLKSIYFERGSGGLWGLVRKYFLLPYRLIKTRPNYVIIPSERYSFVLPFIRKSKSIIVCHDLHTLIDRDTHWFWKCMYKWNLRLLRLATYTVCISKHTEEDLLRVVGLKANRRAVVYNGLHQFWSQDSVDYNFITHQLQLQPQSYILMVGSKAWYKNQLNAFKAMVAVKSARVTVVKVGEIDDRSQQFIHTNLSGKVITLPYVSDDELRVLYKNAAGLLFPSIHEGFGWPALEAMASGCPVITTRKASLEEVCGAAAVYVDPYDVGDISRAIESLLSNRERRSNLVEEGRRQAAKFSWASTVQKIQQLLMSD